jgi:hypothetical protein
MGDCLFALRASVFPAPAGRKQNSPGLQPIGAKISGSRRSVRALHLRRAMQTETVRLHLRVSDGVLNRLS